MRARSIVITGVTRGLGRALAEVFLEAGHTVAGCGRSAEALRAWALPPAPARSAGGRFAVVDVRSDAAVSRWATEVLEWMGPPDMLLNNAAAINANATLWEVGAEAFDAVLDTNVKGVANVLRHFLPAMVARRSGVIVNFSSGWGRSVDAEVAPYCASKWAIEGLTRALALELPPGMAAIPLNPGIIDTEMLRSCFGSAAAGYPTAAAWAERAAPFLLELDGRHNGQALTAPG
jgi:NAD(P)-dependent dehydrogenase (short-subunit alcohol dehydrogenase family)